MQPNIQQVVQPQMMVPNPQMQMGNPQSQLYQVVQSNSTPTLCEKFSKWLTGSYKCSSYSFHNFNVLFPSFHCDYNSKCNSSSWYFMLFCFC